MKKNVEKMITFLNGGFYFAEATNAMQALNFARNKHAGQVREASNEPYVIHPLRMACRAVDLGIRDDAILAAILLHDIVEDCQIPLNGLPVNDRVKEIVRYVTIDRRDDETKSETKVRYFRNMINCPEALIVKGLDRWDNMNSIMMLGADRARHNVEENINLLLPILREAKEKYPEYRAIFYILRDDIENITNLHKYYLSTLENKKAD